MDQNHSIDGNGTNNVELYENFQAVLAMVKESLSEADQARLVQALTPRPEIDSVTPYTWMLDTHRLLTSAVLIMDEGQLQEWRGWEPAIREAPIGEAQRLENLGRLESLAGEMPLSEFICLQANSERYV